MRTDTRSLAAFVKHLDSEIEAGRQGSRFSVLVLSTQPGIFPDERSKLLRWGELVLRNHAPARAAVAVDPAHASCLMLVPGVDEGEAEGIAGYFGEQLNKLPVFGVAPGEGWTWDYATYPDHLEGLQALRLQLAAEEASGQPG